jgi:hypothetical protein
MRDDLGRLVYPAASEGQLYVSDSREDLLGIILGREDEATLAKKRRRDVFIIPRTFLAAHS